MLSSETTDTSDCDLESETFDAKSSLLADADQVLIPIPSAHTFNNIDEYLAKSFGKNKTLKHLQSSSGQSSQSDPQPFVRTLKIEECVSRHKRRELQTVLTKMSDQSIRGPNGLLQKCLNNRIKVLIRRRKSVQLFGQRFGWVSGLLVAFDKHYNLCMTDVDNTYHRLDSQTNVQIKVSTHVKQLFLRGDNVVLISRL